VGAGTLTFRLLMLQKDQIGGENKKLAGLGNSEGCTFISRKGGTNKCKEERERSGEGLGKAYTIKQNEETEYRPTSEGKVRLPKTDLLVIYKKDPYCFLQKKKQNHKLGPLRRIFQTLREKTTSLSLARKDRVPWVHSLKPKKTPKRGVHTSPHHIMYQL